MSYCRWSSDWGRCDLYAYEHYEGKFVVHVATRRHKATDALPPEFDADEEQGGVKRFVALHGKLAALTSDLSDDVYRPLGLPHDGETFELATEREMYSKILELEAMGYRIPKYLHDEATAELSTPEGAPDGN